MSQLQHGSDGGASHPGMSAQAQSAARVGDMPAGDTYRGAGAYDATSSNIGLYAAIGVIALIVAVAVMWVFFR